MNREELERYIQGYSDQQEKDEIAKWLDADEKNMQEFLLLRNIYDTTLWNDEEFTPLVKRGNEEKKSNSKKKILKEIFKIAAIFILGIGCYHLFSGWTEDEANFALQTIYSPGGQRTELVLSDGTKVWLNANSYISFPNQFNKDKRIVELNGEAYFDVAHNIKKQFIVKTNDYQVIVHGTEFGVFAYDDKFEASLIEGSVEVVSNISNESIILLPNTKVQANNASYVVTDLSNTDQFLWKKGILIFDNETVEDMIHKLERYFDVNINVNNDKILNYHFTGKFWINDGIEHIFRVLQLRHDFKYKKDEMNITIY